jgi:predicted DNA-binding transcriptional regulator AlpA
MESFHWTDTPQLTTRLKSEDIFKSPYFLGVIAMSELIDKHEVCKLLGNIHPATLQRGIKAGRFPKPLKVGKFINRWSRDEVETCVKRLMDQRA